MEEDEDEDEEGRKSAGEAITKVQSPAVLGAVCLHQQSLAALPLTPDHHPLLDDVKMFQTGLALVVSRKASRWNAF